MRDFSKDMRFIVYKRKSTKDQESCFQVQEKAVQAWLSQHPNHTVIESFEEQFCGEEKYRPLLIQSIKLCQKHGACLMFPKVDRLTRNSSVITLIKDSGIDALNLENPHAEWWMNFFQALNAESELKNIRARTKASLALKKEMGIKLGPKTNQWRPELCEESARARKIKAETHQANVQAAELAYHMRKGGSSYATIVETLNQIGLLTRNGKQWSKSGVDRLLKMRPVEEEIVLPRGVPMKKGYDERRHILPTMQKELFLQSAIRLA